MKTNGTERHPKRKVTKRTRCCVVKAATVIHRIVLDFPACVRWVWESHSGVRGCTDCQQAANEQEHGQSCEEKRVEEDQHAHRYNLLRPINVRINHKMETNSAAYLHEDQSILPIHVRHMSPHPMRHSYAPVSGVDSKKDHRVSPMSSPVTAMVRNICMNGSDL